MPDRIRKIQPRDPIFDIGWLFVKKATIQAKIRITTVLIAVARLEFTWATPTFASTAVRPAKNAESRAQVNQFIVPSLPRHNHKLVVWNCIQRCPVDI